MNRSKRKLCAGAGWLAIALCGPAGAAVIDPELEAELAARAPGDEVAVIVTLADRINHRLFERRDRSQRDGRLSRELRNKASASQAPHKAFLQARGGHRLRELWAINGMAVKVRADVVREMAKRRGIERIRLDSVLQAPAVTSGTAGPPEWNLAAVRVPDLWSMGFNGTGVVVASMDTGVDASHPDLITRWRGGAGSWFDPHGEHASPYDPSGHGTQTMGIMVGGTAGGTAIGVAPAAQWIATKIYNDAGMASYSDIHLAFQWLLDPDGDPATPDAPDVVNASWGLVGTAGQCINEFSQDVDILKAAGIAVVFAAGNDGPSPLTSLSPANNAAGFSTGAVDSTLAIASFSSRGQSACDGSIYPKMAAPGVNVSTADLSFGGLPLYAVVSGSSYAAPHTAGVIALLEHAFPQATVAELEGALTQSAQDLGVAGPDNSYGYGLTNALSAYLNLAAAAGGTPAITSTPVTSATAGSPYGYTVVASDPAGNAMTYSLDAAPAGMTIDPAGGTISWTPTTAQAGSQAVTARASNALGKFATQSFAVDVALPANRPPTANNDAYAMIKGTTLTVAAPGVLANDSDADAGDSLMAVNFSKGTATGTLTGNAGGGFSYKPAGTFSGTATLSYQAQDSHGALSNAATITVTVTANRPPVAVKDTYTIAVNAQSVFNVLANDYDPDTVIDPTHGINPATVSIYAVPNQGGTAVANADGTITYTPPAGFVGSEVFQYRVKDTRGLSSNPGWVRTYMQ
jgi:bacillopeptidase F